MAQSTSSLEFAPPNDPGGGRAFFLSVCVHVLLLMALTWGVTWRNNPPDDSVEAELWSVVPEPVALKAPPPPAPEPKPEPEPEPKPEPAPPKPPPPAAKPPAPVPKPQPQADLAVEKLKKKEALEKAKEAERLKLAEQKEAAKAKKEKEQREQAQRKAEEDKRKAEEEKRKVEEAKRKAEEEEKRKAEEAKEAEDMRQQQVTRLKSLGASTSGPTDATQEVKGGGKPSDSYLGRLRARVKPNITFSDAQKQSIDGNPTAEVEVICSPSGQIVGMKLTQSSGVAAWDQAVLKALEKTGTLPRDENGTIPSRIPFAFRPKD